MSKLAGEKACFIYSRDLETVSLRYCNVFGPRQSLTSSYAAVIPIFTNHALSGKAPTIFGDGEQTRDFCYVSNIVEGNIKSAFGGVKLRGQTYNIGSGESISINDLWKHIAQIADSRGHPAYAEERDGDIKHSSVSIEKAKRELGYKPAINFGSLLKKTMRWYED
jgi:nucleoside-diphosphate-sugar epimerase